MIASAMPETTRQVAEIAKDPASFSYVTYGWVVGVSVLGAIVRVIREIKLGGKTWKQIVLILSGEILTSVFVGVLTFFLCESASFQPLYTAVMTSIGAYMGGRALTVMEAIYQAIRTGGNP